MKLHAVTAKPGLETTRMPRPPLNKSLAHNVWPLNVRASIDRKNTLRRTLI
jgi:hypothetical protein